MLKFYLFIFIYFLRCQTFHGRICKWDKEISTVTTGNGLSDDNNGMITSEGEMGGNTSKYGSDQKDSFEEIPIKTIKIKPGLYFNVVRMKLGLLTLIINNTKLIFPRLRWSSSNPLHSSTMSTNTTNIVERKNMLRQQIKNKLKHMSETDKLKQTYMVTRRLIKHPDFQQAERIAIYINMKNEVGTYDILNEAFKSQKQVFIPLVIGDNMKMVKLNSIEELHTMPKSKWGIIQPLESDNRENCLDTGGVQYVVVPGVAFTSTGLRLGHGKGYYDRFLTKNDDLRGGRCITVGVAFNEQIVEELPTNESDFRLTWVVYPETCTLSSKYDEMPSEFTPPPEPFTI